ncbi:MAG: hypothetical protein Q9157_003929, partial [Trypethelium eluteriae]
MACPRRLSILLSRRLSVASSALHSGVSTALNGGATGTTGAVPIPVSTGAGSTSPAQPSQVSSYTTDSSGSVVPIVPLTSGGSTVISFPSDTQTGAPSATESIPLTTGFTTSLGGTSVPTVIPGSTPGTPSPPTPSGISPSGVTPTGVSPSGTGVTPSGTGVTPSGISPSGTGVSGTGASATGATGSSISTPGSETSGSATLPTVIPGSQTGLPSPTDTGSTGVSTATGSSGLTSGVSTEATGGTQTMLPPSTASVEGSVPGLSSPPTAAATPPESIQPIGTDAATTLNAGSSIIFTPTPSGSIPPPSETGIPTSIPRIIQPPGGMQPQPNNSTLVQIGFGYSLNYPFVASTYGSASQIFQFLPKGVSHGLDIDLNSIAMHSLQPYDTTQDLHYITTLALFYIPSDQVNALSLNIHTPISAIYNNPDPSVKTLMDLVSPSFPIQAGQGLTGNGSPGSTGQPNPNDPSGASTSASNGGSPIGSDSGASQPVRKSSVGIGVGVCAGAVAYGAAMFIVARRFRNRRREQRAHNRASSLGGD